MSILKDYEKKVEKLSFIGHSLGGLIIRAALPLLEGFQDKMHLLLTMNTPHLGCRNSGTLMMNAGLWVISKVKTKSYYKSKTQLHNQKEQIINYALS